MHSNHGSYTTTEACRSELMLYVIGRHWLPDVDIPCPSEYLDEGVCYWPMLVAR